MLELVLFILLSLTFLQNVSAEEGTPQFVSEDDYIGDVPRVLTVSRLSQPLSDAPSAVTVIDRETIRASGIVDLPEIFRLVPGMYVGTNAGYHEDNGLDHRNDFKRTRLLNAQADYEVNTSNNLNLAWPMAREERVTLMKMLLFLCRELNKSIIITS